MKLYTSSSVYGKDELVLFKDKIYQAVSTIKGKSPETHKHLWTLYTEEPVSFLKTTKGKPIEAPPFVSSKTYKAGDIVTDKGRAYTARMGGSNKNPESSPLYWQYLPEMDSPLVLSNDSTPDKPILLPVDPKEKAKSNALKVIIVEQHGHDGKEGPQGPAGPQGAQGPKGDTGAQGPTGKGDIGPQGIQGPKGDTGSLGPMGPIGPQGAKGDTGDKGEPGRDGRDSPYFEIGGATGRLRRQVVTLESQVPPPGGLTGQVLKKNSGTNYDFSWQADAAGTSAIWGAITGTLSSQTDLQAALDAKLTSVTTDSTLTGSGTGGSPLGFNLTHANNWTGQQNFATLTGFGTVSPVASGHFAQLSSSIAAPVSASFAYQGGASGYYIGQYGGYYYSIYASKLVGATRIYSSAYNASIGDAVDANFAPTSFAASIDYTGSGISNMSQSLTYNIYAIYSTDSSPVTVGSQTVTFDGISGEGVVNLSWVAPVYGVPTEYWIEQGGNYVVVASGDTTYQDSVGSFPSGFMGTTQLYFSIFISTTPVADADQYVYENTTNFTYADGQSDTVSDGGIWTGGSPTVSPTTTNYPTLYSEGDTYICALGASKLLSFYGVTGVAQQSGNLINALGAYGLVTGGFVDSSNIASRGTLSGTSNQVTLSGSGVNALAFSSAITLSLPQNIHTAATPQFQRLGLGVAASSTQSLSITIGTNTHKGAVIKGAASQSGNLVELQSPSSTLLSAFGSGGNLGVRVAPSATAQIITTLGATGNSGLEINGIASQTGDYLAIKSNVGTKAFWFASTGAMGFGSGALAGMANANLAPYLDVSFGGSPATIVMGADLNDVTRTNNTAKYGRFYGAPYAIAQNAVNIMHYAATSSVTELYIGGGSGIGQAFTGLFFYTTPTINTNSGTQRFAMFPSGRIAAGDSLVDSYTARLAIVHTATTTDSTVEIRAMAAQTGNMITLRNSAGTVKSAFNKDGYLAIGEGVLNASSPAAYAQSVYYNTTSISDNSATFKTLTDITNSSPMSTYAWAGMWSRVYKSGTGTTEAIYGIGGQIETLAGAGNIAQSKALYYVMQYASNVTDSRGIDIYSQVSSGATVANHYGLFLRNMAGAGTLTTQYGIYLEDMTKGGTNFAIRSLGGEVAFAGQTNVGLTGGAGKLSVLSTTEQLRLYYDGSNYAKFTTGSTGSVTIDCAGTNPAIILEKKLRLKGYTVATLPAGVAGDTAYVTDALTPTFLTVLVGGGAVTTTCLYNGTNWVAQ